MTGQNSSHSSPQPIAFANLIRLFNQTGTLLLLFPTLWSLSLASQGRPPLHLLLIFILGSFLMRSAGVIMNDLADQRFDREVERTRHRPLASGQLSRTHATLHPHSSPPLFSPTSQEGFLARSGPVS